MKFVLVMMFLASLAMGTDREPSQGYMPPDPVLLFTCYDDTDDKEKVDLWLTRNMAKLGNIKATNKDPVDLRSKKRVYVNLSRITASYLIIFIETHMLRNRDGKVTVVDQDFVSGEVLRKDHYHCKINGAQG